MSIPSRNLPRVLWRRVLREIRTRTAPRRPRGVYVGANVQEIAAQFRSREMPRFFAVYPEHAPMVGQFFPEARIAALDAAGRVMAHRFDILGSGEVDLGENINWHTDFKSGHTWPLEHYTRLTLVAPGGGYDVKVPWELSRFHHALRLGQAYLYTGEEAYAQEVVNQIGGWIEANPYEFGVNWAGPMDVAIRAVNWLWAVHMVLYSQAVTDDFLAMWLTSLRQHGEYLSKHLEDGWPHTNHLIADLTGLAYLGLLLPEFQESVRWRELGLGRLWQEIDQQVNPDGMDYESSISYHRLVTEMGLSVAALCLMNGIAIPPLAQARLTTMLDVIMAYTQPDGTAPAIGDADDGRLHPLTIHADPDRTVNDHRHLLALGSMIFERDADDWAGYTNPKLRGWAIAAGNEWQDAFWFFPMEAAARFTDMLTQSVERPEDARPDSWISVRPGVRLRARALSQHPITRHDVAGSRGFEPSGLYVMQHEDSHLTMSAGGVGQDGAGGHAHNDALSITLSAYGRTFLIDPGTYVYTADPAMRNFYRSTASHNTVQIGTEEINPLPAELFRLPDTAQVMLHHWVVQPGFDLLDASHRGYARLDPGVIHRRQVWFDKANKLWVLHDRLSPLGSEARGEEVDLTLWFHFAPLALRLDRAANAIHTGEPDGPNLTILPLGSFPLEAKVVQGRMSPRYGVECEAPVAKFTGCVKLPVDLVLLLYPHRSSVALDAVQMIGREALATMRRVLTPVLQMNKD